MNWRTLIKRDTVELLVAVVASSFQEGWIPLLADFPWKTSGDKVQVVFRQGETMGLGSETPGTGVAHEARARAALTVDFSLDTSL